MYKLCKRIRRDALLTHACRSRPASCAPLLMLLLHCCCCCCGVRCSAAAAQVNADSHRSLGERFGVSGFPTIKWFSRGKPVTTDAAEA